MDGGPIDEEQTVSHFLFSLYGGPESVKDVLNEIGIRKLNPSQLTCLSELPLASLYCCLKLFATWMEEGMYDFSTLPYTIKAHLSSEDRTILKAIPQNWDGELQTLHIRTLYYTPFFILSPSLSPSLRVAGKK